MTQRAATRNNGLAERQGFVILKNRCLIDTSHVGVASSCSVGFDRAQDRSMANTENAGKEDPFDLRRFVKAQDGVYERARDELRDGRKRSHWIWYVFPQMKGLGFSTTSHLYGIGSPRRSARVLGTSGSRSTPR